MRKRPDCKQAFFLDELCGAGVVQDGHFIYTSQVHGCHQFQDERRMRHHPVLMYELGRELATFQAAIPVTANCVVGLAQHTAPLTSATALALNRDQLRTGEVTACYGEFVSETRDFQFIDQEHLLRKRRVFVVIDVLRDDVTIPRVVQSLALLQASVIGVGVVWDARLRPTASSLPVEALLIERQLRYSSKECPACKNGTPVTRNFRRSTDRAA